jgi:hypothetical protein
MQLVYYYSTGANVKITALLQTELVGKLWPENGILGMNIGSSQVLTKKQILIHFVL